MLLMASTVLPQPLLLVSCVTQSCHPGNPNSCPPELFIQRVGYVLLRTRDEKVGVARNGVWIHSDSPGIL